MNAALLSLLLAATPPATSVGEVASAVVEPEARPVENKPAEPPAPGPNEVGGHVKDLVAGGTHWRLMTDHGPVHLWRPQGFDQKTAGTLVYLHGFYTNVDEAWEMHHLAEQFRASRRNALFVVPETPSGAFDKVSWPTLTGLFEAIHAQSEVVVPAGPVAVMGHSGAFRTLLVWLNEPRLEQIFLLDGLYNSEADYLGWLRPENKPPNNKRLVIVGFETAERSEAFLPNFTEALFREGVPDSPGQFRRRERQAKLLYIHSQYDHMGIVTEGRAIPVLLRLAPFRPL